MLLLQSHLLVPVKTNADQALCSLFFPPTHYTLNPLRITRRCKRPYFMNYTFKLLWTAANSLDVLQYQTFHIQDEMGEWDKTKKKKIILIPFSNIPSYCSNPFTSYAMVKNLSFPFLIQIEACICFLALGRDSVLRDFTYHFPHLISLSNPKSCQK